MENKKGINFFFAVLAVILGVVTFKQFDFERWEFEKPALAFVYVATFVLSIYFLIRNYRKQPGK